MCRNPTPHRKYTYIGLVPAPLNRSRARLPGRPRAREQPQPATVERTIFMLDVIYLAIGAIFLGACVLYAHACDHL